MACSLASATKSIREASDKRTRHKFNQCHGDGTKLSLQRFGQIAKQLGCLLKTFTGRIIRDQADLHH